MLWQPRRKYATDRGLEFQLFPVMWVTRTQVSLSFTAASQGAHKCETRLEINVVLQHKYSKVRCGHKKLNDSKEAKHTAWLLTVCKLEHY